MGSEEMKLRQALRLSQAPCLALVGAGGKSTALFELARQFPPPVLLSTTTHLAIEQAALADSHHILPRAGDLPQGGVILATGRVEEAQGKLAGLDEGRLRELYTEAQRRRIPFLLECDGSRSRPLKAPAAHEPPIPDFVDQVVLVAGLSGVGQPLEEAFVHRPEIFGRLAGLQRGEVVNVEALARVLNHPQGGLKNIPSAARRVVLLNQADDERRQSLGRGLAERLLPFWDAVVIASLQQGEVFAVHERVAAIVLAAGGARRFGRPKQVLEWEGKPLVRHLAERALQADLRPVIVVTGWARQAVEAALHGLPVKLAFNPHWERGQASSVRRGIEMLRALDPQAGAAIFLLADQPGVSVLLLRSLVERHAADLPPVVAPRVGDRRANPVLFDRQTFDDLEHLEGDQGGRALFTRYPPVYLPWHDERLLIDLDTPQDLERWRAWTK
jgi:molybdenum cofactor cytidylyltransferase